MIVACILLSATLCRAVKDKPVMLLTAASSASLMADGITTKALERRGYQESDPIARFLIGRHPTWARMTAAGLPLVIGETWLAERMRTSRHKWERKLWWLPQTVQIGANFGSAVRNGTLE